MYKRQEYVYTDSLIWGFTQTHLNGTGCMDLGDILVMPVSYKHLILFVTVLKRLAPIFEGLAGVAVHVVDVACMFEKHRTVCGVVLDGHVDIRLRVFIFFLLEQYPCIGASLCIGL